jgi:ubiquinone/menaquinone biosynthesis C-methylase UbiE
MAQQEKRTAVFKPEVFEVPSLEQAKSIIVTGERGITTDEHWQKETPFLAGDVVERLKIGPETLVLDYGCGIGRIAKELIARCGCRVMGIDASKAMRELAPGYVLSERFNIWSPEVFAQMLDRDFHVDCAISLWVIQHVLDPKQTIGLIHRALRPGGLFYALNQQTRCVPTDLGWVNDGIDVWAALAETFAEQERYNLPESVSTAELSRMSVIQVLRRTE